MNTFITGLLDELIKMAFITGEIEPEFAGSMHPGIPFSERLKAFEEYAKRKSKEEPTRLRTALGAGGLIGAPIGAGLGAMAAGGGSFGIKGKLIAALIGGLAGGGLGAGAGALVRKIDKDEIDLLRDYIANKKEFGSEVSKRMNVAEKTRTISEILERERQNKSIVEAIRELKKNKEET
jgi:hypothetical protein